MLIVEFEFRPYSQTLSSSQQYDPPELKETTSDHSEDCGSGFRRQIVMHIRCTKAGVRRNNVVSTTHPSLLRWMSVEKQLSVSVMGMFERPLLLNLHNLKDVKCVSRYVVKLHPNLG